MSLHNGLDIEAIATLGVYSSTYNSVSAPGNIANLFASRGLLEVAPDAEPSTGLSWIKKMFDWFWELF